MDALHALVIDDDLGVAELIARILLKEDIQVVVAGSAEEGLEQLPHFVFDLAFLDHNLPGMEGLVLGEFLRRNNPEMQVALVTGEDPSTFEELTRAQGIVLIPKPFEVRDILDLVSRLKSVRRERDAVSNATSSREHAVPIAEHGAGIRDAFAMPGVSQRLVDRIQAVVKERIARIQRGRYTESERVEAVAGLLAAEVLGVDLQRSADGSTLQQEYDRAMRRDGRRCEFDEGGYDTE
jgi:DNA-binding NtrC family response regulator